MDIEKEQKSIKLLFKEVKQKPIKILKEKRKQKLIKVFRKKSLEDIDRNNLTFKLSMKYNMTEAEVYDLLLEAKGKETIEQYYMDLNKVPYRLSNDKEFLENCIKWEKFNLILYFDEKLFTEEIISKYGKILRNSINHIPYGMNKNKHILEKCIKLGLRKIDLFLEFDEKLFTEEIIEKYGASFLDFIHRVPYSMRKNKHLFEKCLEFKKYRLVHQFDESLFTEETTSKYGEIIINAIDYIPYCMKKDKFPYYMNKNKCLLEKCIELEKFNFISEFETSLFTEKIIDKYGEIIINSIDYVPKNLENNKYLLEKCIELKKFNLVLDFDLEIVTPKIIDKYGKEILSSKNYIPEHFGYDKYLLNKCIELKMFNLALEFFDESLFTEEIIDKCGDQIKNYIYPTTYNNNEEFKTFERQEDEDFIATDYSKIDEQPLLISDTEATSDAYFQNLDCQDLNIEISQDKITKEYNHKAKKYTRK